MAVSRRAGHGLAAGASVVIAAGVGLLTNLVTDRWQPTLALALLALVIAGVACEAWLAVSAVRSPKNGRVTASGIGSIAVGGDNQGELTTRIRLATAPAPVSAEADGVSASGPGTVAIGGENTSHVETDAATQDPSSLT